MLAVLITAPGCKADVGAALDDAATGDGGAQVSDAVVDALTECPDDPGEESDWNHTTTEVLVITQGAPHHSARDPIINPGDGFELAGKFAYGAASKDLQDEEVVAYVQVAPCTPWQEVGRGVTDSDGRIVFAVAGELLPGVGRYDFQMVVGGDLSRARAGIYVVASGQQAVVFDIDATLTTSDAELFEEILAGTEPDKRIAADQVVRRYAAKGYFVVYLTGRPYFLDPASRAWLAARDFPIGPVRTTDSISDTLPTQGAVGAFKTAYLIAVSSDAGVEFRYAYGNATTDICAFANSGIDTARTYTIGDNAGAACDGHEATQPLTDYPTHLPDLDDLPPAS